MSILEKSCSFITTDKFRSRNNLIIYHQRLRILQWHDSFLARLSYDLALVLFEFFEDVEASSVGRLATNLALSDKNSATSPPLKMRLSAN